MCNGYRDLRLFSDSDDESETHSNIEADSSDENGEDSDHDMDENDPTYRCAYSKQQQQMYLSN